MGQALEAILHKFNINSKMVCLKQPETCKSPLGTPRSDSRMSAGHVKVKPATPSDFDGDCEKGRAFLNTCTIYLAICRDSFLNNQARIYWALSFKSGRVAHLTDQVLQMLNKDKPYYQDWDDFWLDFTEQFCPRNEQLSALTKLEGTSGYQGKDSVEDYIDRFQELIDISGYSNSKTIVIKFQRGLDPEI